MSGKRILLIEDNPDDEELTVEALRTGGVTAQIMVARDGADALDYLFGTGKHATTELETAPHLVLLDLRLPKIPGLEVLRRIRANAQTRYLPVVILTSSSEESDKRSGYENGANSYVRKPVEFEQFIRAVQHLGAYWTLFNETPARP